MAAYQVLIIPDLLRNITNFHTDALSLFILNSRTDGMARRKNQIVTDEAAAFVLAKRGNIDLLNAVLSADILIYWDTIGREAIKWGNLHVLEWLQTAMPYYFPHMVDNGIRIAAQHGQLEIMKFLDQNGYGHCSTYAAHCAASGGFLPVLEWLYYTKKVDFTVTAMNLAASAGHLHLVEWFHINSPAGCTTQAMDWAAAGGDLAMVQWLHLNRTEGCSSSAMAEALGHGYIDIAEWLYRNRTEGCADWAPPNLVQDDQMESIKWLIRRYPEHNIAIAKHAATLSRMHILDYVLKNSKHSIINELVKHLVHRENVAVLSWLRSNHLVKYTTAALNFALSLGKNKVAEWLKTEGVVES